MAAQAGIAASGHTETSRAATLLLEAGGNAFDAALGALCAACVCEPMLASFGGGGFLMAQPAQAPSVVYDFFVQTPGRHKPVQDIDFYPILADFGTATQEFHIGVGSIAVPGVVAGLFAVHKANCRLPLKKIIEPAVYLAREGLRINNGVVEITENPDNLPCYTDGLLKSMANYIWRTNDIVYLPDSPRGRPGG